MKRGSFVTAKAKKAKEASRQFAQGERVRVSKKSRVVDEDRLNEGQDPSTLPIIDQDVTGFEGEVCGDSYDAPSGKGVCIPIKLPNHAVISVPEDRLERADRSLRRLDGGGQIGSSPPTKESIEFWRDYFKKRGEIKGEKK